MAAHVAFDKSRVGKQLSRRDKLEMSSSFWNNKPRTAAPIECRSDGAVAQGFRT
jgi:hypothetical protein